MLQKVLSRHYRRGRGSELPSLLEEDDEGGPGQDEASGWCRVPGPKENRQVCLVRASTGSCTEPQQLLCESSRNPEVIMANHRTRHNMLLEMSSLKQGQQWKGVALHY